MSIKKHLPLLGALLPFAASQADNRPNVVIIYIDDMGIGDIGCYGGKFEKDDLAATYPGLVKRLGDKVRRWFEENKDKGKITD